MSGTIATIPRFQFFDATGAPLAGGSVTTYVTGTTNPTTTWSDAALSTPNTNPVVLDSSGTCILWLSNLVVYRFVIKDLNGIIVPNGTIDGIIGGAGTVITSFPTTNAILTNGDLGKIIYASGTFTQTFNACASLGANWSLTYYNVGSGVITLDPNGGELIDGATTLLLAAHEGVSIACDGAALYTSGVVSAKLSAQIFTAFTTSGSAGTLTLSTVPIVNVLAPNQRFRVKFSAASTGNDTLNVDSLGAKIIKQYNAYGAKVAAVFSVGQLVDVEYDGTDYVLLASLPSPPPVTVPIRQTVLSGPCNTDGTPNLGGSTGGTSVTTSNISTGINALVVTAATGFGTGGQTDVVGMSTSNLTWTGLSTNGTNYLYVIVTNGGLVPAIGLLPPVYTDSSVLSTTLNQFSYSISDGYGVFGNGSVATQVSAVYVGEVSVSGSVVTAIRWYAYKGKFSTRGNPTTLSALSTLTTFSTNIGSPIQIVRDSTITCISADSGYSIGDRMPFINSYNTNTVFCPALGVSDSNTVFMATSGNYVLPNKGAANAVSITPSKWSLTFNADRGF